MTSKCLACGGELGDVLFSIPDLPLVDSFCVSRDAASTVPTYTINMRQCDKCLTIQIDDPPDTSEIYKNYIYESSSSPDLSDHFTDYAQEIANLVDSTDKPILEIGANDGLLLHKLTQKGFTDLVGIDPSPQTAKISIDGVRIINDFFSESTTANLEPSSFSVIIANNCFSHIPSLCSILNLCSKFLSEHGSIVIEVQSCLDLLEGVIFDYIYHEHFFYHSIHSFERLAEFSGLEIYRVTHVQTKGGSYRIFLGHPKRHLVEGNVAYWKYREEIAKIHTKRSWTLLSSYLDSVKTDIHYLIEKTKKPLVGYGASATSTVFLSYMQIEGNLRLIIDDNPRRQGLFAPHSCIPVVSSANIQPLDICMILAWRHSNYIKPKLESFGIPWIIPLPFLQSSV